MSSGSRSGDNVLKFVDLSLGSLEGTKLIEMLVSIVPLLLQSAYSSLGQLSRSLVSGVAQQFNHTSLIWSQTSDFLDDITDESRSLGQVTLCAGDLCYWSEGCNFLLAGVISIFLYLLRNLAGVDFFVVTG